MGEKFGLMAWCLCWGAVLVAVIVSFLLMSLGVDMSIIVVVFVLTLFGMFCMYCLVSIPIARKKASRDKIRKQALSGGYGYSPQSQRSIVTPIGRFCLECGSIVNEDDKFCKNCGARF